MTQEELARRRKEDKEQKLAQFQSKTKANASRKLREEAENRKKEADSK